MSTANPPGGAVAFPAEASAAAQIRTHHGTALSAASAAYLAALGLMALVFTSSPPPRLDGHLDALHDVDSLPYALDLAGYALLGIAAITLATALIGREARLTAIGWLLIVMGLLSLAALGLHGAGQDTAASIATATSGACTLPVAVLSLVHGQAVRRRATSVMAWSHRRDHQP